MATQRGGTSLSSDFYERIKSRLYQRIAREVRTARRVLDLGCGRCELARFLAKTGGHKVTGVDIEYGALPNYRALAKDTRWRLRCIKADARSLDFLADGSIDAVTMVWTLHEMAHPAAVLGEARGVLRPGGELLIIDFPRGSLAQELWNEAYYAPEELSEMMQQAGYEAVSVTLIERGQVIWAKGLRPRHEEALQ